MIPAPPVPDSTIFATKLTSKAKDLLHAVAESIMLADELTFKRSFQYDWRGNTITYYLQFDDAFRTKYPEFDLSGVEEIWLVTDVG